MTQYFTNLPFGHLTHTSLVVGMNPAYDCLQVDLQVCHNIHLAIEDLYLTLFYNQNYLSPCGSYLSDNLLIIRLPFLDDQHFAGCLDHFGAIATIQINISLKNYLI